jgi:hypothetical protein
MERIKDDKKEIIKKKIDEIKENNYFDFSDLEIEFLNFDIYENNIMTISINNVKYKCNLTNSDDLYYLFINDNKIKHLNINFDLSLFSKLKVLDISDNPIEEILSLPQFLEELVCNNCSLKYICGHSKLKKLHIMDNKICDINEYPCLLDLKCDNNNIEYINFFPKLKFLCCANNPIKKIDLIPNLKMIDCSITLLEGEINFAPLLTHLICNKTKISDISQLSEIEGIEFIDSNIKCLPYFSRLKSIIFSDKDIKLSPKYKILKFLEYGGNFDIVFR